MNHSQPLGLKFTLWESFRPSRLSSLQNEDDIKDKMKHRMQFPLQIRHIIIWHVSLRHNNKICVTENGLLVTAELRNKGINVTMDTLG